jgi:hypothetical protein
VATNKTVPTDPLKLIAFFKQCQVSDKAAGVLEKITKNKMQSKEKKTAHLPTIIATSIATTIKATNTIATTNNPTIVIKTINAMIVLVAMIRTLRAASPRKKKDDCKHNHFKKKSDEAMHNDQSSLSSASTSSRKRSRSCSRFPSCSCSQSCSCLSSRSYDNHHLAQDDHKLSALPKRGYLYFSKSDDGRCIHCPDKSDTIFATLSAPTAKSSKCSHK